MILFNKPSIIGNEIKFINDAIASGHISGNGKYTKLCHQFFEETYGFSKALLTTSCTDALEMAAILLDIKEGDEIIMPSFTFVSTANAFVLRGANVIFVDSEEKTPNIDPKKIEEAISNKTKAIVIVHYAGFACDMDKIVEIVKKNKLYLVEDAAQAIENFFIDSKKHKKPLGSFGDLATFSFHETKNVNCGEGGLLIINNEKFIHRAEIIWEKGTNRSSFFRGEVDKYGWVDVGSSFLPSELNAAFLYAQLQKIELIQSKRKKLVKRYYENFKKLSLDQISLMHENDYSTCNAHMFYIICENLNVRTRLIEFLKKNQILSVFHYIPLHSSPYYFEKQGNDVLVNAQKFSDRLLRLPLYFALTESEVDYIVEKINYFYKNDL
jgi:dTDP-4-amino-4,6-dideoxygalactose transaminase